MPLLPRSLPSSLSTQGKISPSNQLLPSLPSPLRNACDYEQAYCLFRLHRHQEAYEAAKKLPSSDPKKHFREIELQAQIVRYTFVTCDFWAGSFSPPSLTPPCLVGPPHQLYRLERFDECTALYKTIIDVEYDDFGLERETNVMAAQAAAALAGSEVSMSNATCFPALLQPGRSISNPTKNPTTTTLPPSS